MKKKVTKRRPKGFFSTMTDPQLIHYFNDNCKHLSGRELNKAEATLYHQLRKRLLIHIVPSKKRSFSTKSNLEITGLIKKNHAHHSIRQFQTNDPSLYDVALKRGLIDKLVDKQILQRRNKKRGMLSSLTNTELIEYITTNLAGITISEMIRKDATAYSLTRDRDLIDQLVQKGILVRKRPKHNGKTPHPNGWYKDWIVFYTELKKAITHFGYFPIQHELRKSCYSYINLGITFYGGHSAIREKIGHPIKRHPTGHWNNWDTYSTKLQEIISTLGHFPSHKELEKPGYSNLKLYMRYFGGTANVRERIGYNQQKREALAQKLETILREIT